MKKSILLVLVLTMVMSLLVIPGNDVAARRYGRPGGFPVPSAEEQETIVLPTPVVQTYVNPTIVRVTPCGKRIVQVPVVTPQYVLMDGYWYLKVDANTYQIVDINKVLSLNIPAQFWTLAPCGRLIPYKWSYSVPYYGLKFYGIQRFGCRFRCPCWWYRYPSFVLAD